MFFRVEYPEDSEEVCQLQNIMNGRAQSEQNEVFFQFSCLFKDFDQSRDARTVYVPYAGHIQSEPRSCGQFFEQCRSQTTRVLEIDRSFQIDDRVPPAENPD